MGGEEISIRSVYQSFQGSPPRRRGKADKDDVSGLDLGITPAWAGKSFDSLTVCRRLRDHPRMGGEKLLDRYWIGTGLGDTKDHPRVGGEKMHLSLTLAHDTLHALTQFFNRVAFVDKLQNRSE